MLVLLTSLTACTPASATPPPPPKATLYFAQNTDEEGPWVQIAAPLDDGLEHFGSEFARSATVTTHSDGGHHVWALDWIMGDGAKEHTHTFGADGALVSFRQTEGAFGDMCGEWEGKVEIQAGPRRYKRSYEVSLDGGKPLDPEIAADCPPLSTTDPGWQPEWLAWDQVPAPFRDAKAP